VKPELFGVSIPTDPGDIEVEASAPGYAPFSEDVPLAARQRRQVTIASLQRLPGNDPPPIPQTVPAAPELPPDGRHPDIRPIRYTSQPSPVAYVLGGAGVVGIGVGSFFGLRAIARNNEAKRDYDCHGGTCTQKAGLDVTDEAVRAARISNVAFAAGGALLVGGLIVYLTAPRKAESALLVVPGAGPSGASLWLKSAF
jgi:hypothetical protein